MSTSVQKPTVKSDELDSHPISSPQGTLYDAPPVRDENDTLREELRELIFGSGKIKRLASTLWPGMTVARAQTRLYQVLEDDPETFLDLDLLVPTLKILGPAAANRFAHFFLAKLDLAARNGLSPRRQPTGDELGREILDEERELKSRLDALMAKRRRYDAAMDRERSR